MSANKSIIEEALLEAKQIEEAVKTNTKEILAQTMMPEIENMVKESLTEDDLDEKGEEQVTEDEESVTVDAQIDDEDEESDEDDDRDDEEVAIVAVSDEDDDEGIEMGGQIEMPSIVDLTSSSDEEVIKVFKELSDNDEVEVVGDVVKIKAKEETEYRVEVPGVEVESTETISVDEGGMYKGDQGGGDYPGDKHTDVGYKPTRRGDSGGDQGGFDFEEGDEPIYEIELDEAELTEDELYEIESGLDEEDIDEKKKDKNWGGNKKDYKRKSKKGVKKKTGDEDGHYKDYEGKEGGNKDDDSETDKGDKDYTAKKGSESKTHAGKDYEKNEGEDEIEEASRTAGFGSKKGRGLRKAFTNNRNLEFNEGVEAELTDLRSKNGEYKEALKVFRKKLNEIAVFNSNLAYATKLFMEHSTTKSEKMNILKRFDDVSTLKESKSLYRSIEGEMGTKAPITESIEKSIKTPKAGALIKEDTAYVDPQVARMKFLMEKLG